MHRFSIGLVYNISNQYPLFDYLEYPFLVVQDIFLLAIVLSYSKQLGLVSVSGLAVYLAVVVALTRGVFPASVIVTLMVILLFLKI